MTDTKEFVGEEDEHHHYHHRHEDPKDMNLVLSRLQQEVSSLKKTASELSLAKKINVQRRSSYQQQGTNFYNDNGEITATPTTRSRSSISSYYASENAILRDLILLDQDNDDDADAGDDEGQEDESIASCSVAFASLPENGMPAEHVREMIEQIHICNFNPRLNTASYVNVVSEQEERQVAMLGATVNLADTSVYPASIEIHDTVIAMLARLWNVPKPNHGKEKYSGTATVGSTEACLLAGLALKARWRKWYSKQFNAPMKKVVGIRPNIVISSTYQAAWEKFCRFLDIDAKFVKPNLVQDKMVVNAKQMIEQCDEKTIAVVGILGNHYNGSYDPIWEIDAELEKFNKTKGYQIGIHVDAASGGFIAPFQKDMKPFDFRLRNVLSFSASGHKFGESAIGTGWLIFRQREDLGEHLVISDCSVNGSDGSMTLNTSRPASGVYVQYYKLLRLGIEGYQQKVYNQMLVASYIRRSLTKIQHKPSGKPMFQLVDYGDIHCLPVVSARINPNLGIDYDDIDLQHAMSESHWYVGGYKLSFEHIQTGHHESIVSDVSADKTMFRIVCKSNLTMSLAHKLCKEIKRALVTLDRTQERIVEATAKELIRQRQLLSSSTGKLCTTAKNVNMNYCNNTNDWLFQKKQVRLSKYDQDDDIFSLQSSSSLWSDEEDDDDYIFAPATTAPSKRQSQGSKKVCKAVDKALMLVKKKNTHCSNNMDVGVHKPTSEHTATSSSTTATKTTTTSTESKSSTITSSSHETHTVQKAASPVFVLSDFILIILAVIFGIALSRNFPVQSILSSLLA